MREKIYDLQCRMERSKTVKFGVYFLMSVGITLVSGVGVSILNTLVSIIPFGFAAIAAIVGVALALVALIGIVGSVISFFCFLWNVIKDIFSLPGKAVQKAKKEKAQKECEQARIKLQAKIDAEAAPYRTMADNGDTTAMREVAKVYYKNGKEKEARNIYETAASKGDADAQLTLAQNYKQIGTAIAMKWASYVESNPDASEEQKESARNQEQAIAEYEQYLERKQEEDMERFRQAQEQKRREEEAYQVWKEKEMQVPITGDHFVPRTYGETCRNQGAACRYCARRRWYPGGWGDDDCRIGM